LLELTLGDATCYKARLDSLEVGVYAVIKTGGKQYRVAEGDTVQVEREVLSTLDGDKVSFDEVLFVGGDSPKIGAPMVEGAKVSGSVIREFRGEKIFVFRKKRRQHHIKRKIGHRQDLVAVRIDSIKA
jgi:large subunit ribosomal protein L21